MDGLNLVLYLSIPSNVFDGGWSLGTYVDQRTNPEQVEALRTILGGQAGGCFEPNSGLIANPLAPQQVPLVLRRHLRRNEVPGIMLCLDIFELRLLDTPLSKR